MGSFPDALETERLRYERLCRANVSARTIHQYTNVDAPDVEEVSEYALWDPHRTLDETRDYLAAMEEKWDRGEQATYGIRTRRGVNAGEFVGITAINVDWERRTGELDLWLRKPFWGRGYSGERAGVLLRLAFDELGLDLVGVSHQEGNENSKRAIRRYIGAHGGQYADVLHDFTSAADGARDLHRYTVSREQYRNAMV